jgi:hypothetical protein
MSTSILLRDAYKELDQTGSLSRLTRETLLHAGINPRLVESANEASKETEED